MKRKERARRERNKKIKAIRDVSTNVVSKIEDKVTLEIARLAFKDCNYIEIDNREHDKDCSRTLIIDGATCHIVTPIRRSSSTQRHQDFVIPRDLLDQYSHVVLSQRLEGRLIRFFVIPRIVLRKSVPSTTKEICIRLSIHKTQHAKKVIRALGIERFMNNWESLWGDLD
jgi:hypothetical protein